MKKIFIILCLTMFCFLPIIAANAAEKKAAKNKSVDIEYETADKFLLNATLTYPKEKGKVYPVIVLLHSIGSSSGAWDTLPQKFNEAGFAVLNVDLRGHGKSIYNINLDKKYWQNMSLKAYSKYPADITGLMNYVKDEYKNISFTNYVIIGADLGANTAVLAAQKMSIKPFAIVLISPQTTFKGLYIPVALADLTTTNVLFVYSQQDFKTVKEVNSLKRFAQGEITDIACQKGGSGISIIKTNPKSVFEIVNWCVKECNSYLDKFSTKK